MLNILFLHFRDKIDFFKLFSLDVYRHAQHLKHSAESSVTPSGKIDIQPVLASSSKVNLVIENIPNLQNYYIMIIFHNFSVRKGHLLVLL